jgi:hypothetical protein
MFKVGQGKIEVGGLMRAKATEKTGTRTGLISAANRQEKTDDLFW